MDRLRVLVTDDELGMRLGVERTLRDFTVRIPDVNGDVGFTVEQAETGEAALEIIRTNPPDLLLLDHKLPGVSGLEVLDAIAGRQLDMLTIMITAYASIETAVTATKRGAYDFLAKPFTPEEIRNTVRKAAARLVLAKQARKLAEEKRQVRFQFIRVLGHELKAPLNAIEGYLQLLRAHTLGDAVAAYDEVVDRSVVRIEGMRKLIADLLDMTRVESGQRDRWLAPLDLVAAVRRAIETILPEARRRGIEVEIHVPEPVAMIADPDEIDIILNNLLSNAVKYNRDNGRVDVGLTRDANVVTIRVADTGIGMTTQDAAKLFGEFVRIRNEKTRHVLGSGLGLSIVKRLALLYDGDATVESEPDAGSTFTINLKDPVNPAAAGASAAAASERA